MVHVIFFNQPAFSIVTPVFRFTNISPPTSSAKDFIQIHVLISYHVEGSMTQNGSGVSELGEDVVDNSEDT